MTEYFEATHEFANLPSSFVEAVWYNETTRQAVVSLEHGVMGNSGNTNRYYFYENVPLDAVEAMVGADSVGAAYNVDFKPTYGPATKSLEETNDYSLFIRYVHPVDVDPSDVVSVPKDTFVDATDSTQEYSLTYSWQGQDFPAYTIETTGVIDAVQKLASILRELGLNGAVIQVPVDELV